MIGKGRKYSIFKLLLWLLLFCVYLLAVSDIVYYFHGKIFESLAICIAMPEPITVYNHQVDRSVCGFHSLSTYGYWMFNDMGLFISDHDSILHHFSLPHNTLHSTSIIAVCVRNNYPQNLVRWVCCSSPQ